MFKIRGFADTWETAVPMRRSCPILLPGLVSLWQTLLPTSSIISLSSALSSPAWSPRASCRSPGANSPIHRAHVLTSVPGHTYGDPTPRESVVTWHQTSHSCATWRSHSSPTPAFPGWWPGWQSRAIRSPPFVTRAERAPGMLSGPASLPFPLVSFQFYSGNAGLSDTCRHSRERLGHSCLDKDVEVCRHLLQTKKSPHFSGAQLLQEELYQKHRFTSHSSTKHFKAPTPTNAYIPSHMGDMCSWSIPENTH